MIFAGGQFFGAAGVPEFCAGASPVLAGSDCGAVAEFEAEGAELAGAGAESQPEAITFFR